MQQFYGATQMQKSVRRTRKRAAIDSRRQDQILARLLRIMVVRMANGLPPDEREKFFGMLQSFAIHLDGVSLPEALTVVDRLVKRASPKQRALPRDVTADTDDEKSASPAAPPFFLGM